jgi:hypothetical protein
VFCSDERDAIGASARNSYLDRLLPALRRATWLALERQKNTLAEIVDKLNTEINAVLAEPEQKGRLSDLGGTVLAGSPAEFGKLIADEAEKWDKIVRPSASSRSDARTTLDPRNSGESKCSPRSFRSSMLVLAEWLLCCHLPWGRPMRVASEFLRR